MIEETLVQVADDLEWAVRAFEYPTADKAREVWEQEEAKSKGKGNFSIWRTMNPEMTRHFVIVCGRPELLPVLDGEPYVLTDGEAHMFALRRAKVGADWVETHPDPDARMDQEIRYGENAPVTIDPTTGEAKPYKWKN